MEKIKYTTINNSFMAFLKKLAFWKHEDEFEQPLPDAPSVDKSFSPKFSPLSEQGLEPSFVQPLSPPLPHNLPSQYSEPELRVISAKLDTIKALIEMMNQRLERIEGRKGDELVKWR